MCVKYEVSDISEGTEMLLFGLLCDLRIYCSYDSAFTGLKPKSGPFQQQLRKMVVQPQPLTVAVLWTLLLGRESRA
jgi:hypothetical protein